MPNKEQHAFVISDIENFYPTVSEKLVKNAISFAMKQGNATEKDINIIIHARKLLLFNNGTAWMKTITVLDITMGSFNSAEVC